MKNNLSRYTFLSACMMCFTLVAAAQKKISERKFSDEIAKVKVLQANRNMMAARMKQSTPAQQVSTPNQQSSVHANNSNAATTTPPGEVNPAHGNVKTSQQKMQLPPRRIVHQKQQ